MKGFGPFDQDLSKYQPEYEQSIKYLENVLQSAETTGLQTIYRKILLSPRIVQFIKFNPVNILPTGFAGRQADVGEEQTVIGSIIHDIFSYTTVLTIAYQQKRYGNGQPYQFDKTKSASDTKNPFLTWLNEQQAFIINYETPAHTIIPITCYSFFYSMLNYIPTLLLSPLASNEKENLTYNLDALKAMLQSAEVDVGGRHPVRLE
jgi:hypothetical protein